MYTNDPPEPKASRPLAYCEETRRLLDLFSQAARELLRLHHQQLVATIEDEPDCHRFDLLIQMANDKKEQAKYAYMFHIETHGCSAALKCAAAR